MLWPKKIHTGNLITKKNSCGLKIPGGCYPSYRVIRRVLSALAYGLDG